MKNNFRYWLTERAVLSNIYGFKEPDDPPIKPQDENPVQAFAMSRLLSMLLKNKLGDVEPNQRFEDEIRWGSGNGAVRVKISPNYILMISRACPDLQGDTIWICKRIYSIDQANFTGKEDSVASDIFEKVKDIAQEPIEKPDRNWNNLKTLVTNVAREVRSAVPGVYMYEDIKEVGSREYIIYFSVSGAGVGRLKPSGRERSPGLTPYLNINLSYDLHTGLIRTICNTISIEPDGGFWNIDIPFIDERFMPSQKEDEIVKLIITAVRNY